MVETDMLLYRVKERVILSNKFEKPSKLSILVKVYGKTFCVLTYSTYNKERFCHLHFLAKDGVAHTLLHHSFS